LAGRIEHPLGAGQVVAHRLLQIDVPSVSEEFYDALDMQRNRQQRLHGVDLETTGRQLGGRCERPWPGPVGLPLLAALFTRVDQSDDLHIGIVEVGAHVQVVDPAEADESGTYGTVVCGPFLLQLDRVATRVGDPDVHRHMMEPRDPHLSLPYCLSQDQPRYRASRMQ
jgi:hypothetical protein